MSEVNYCPVCGSQDIQTSFGEDMMHGYYFTDIICRNCSNTAVPHHRIYRMNLEESQSSPTERDTQ